MPARDCTSGGPIENGRVLQLTFAHSSSGSPVSRRSWRPFARCYRVCSLGVHGACSCLDVGLITLEVFSHVTGVSMCEIGRAWCRGRV